MNDIDWAKVRKEVEQEVIADKTAEILADSDAYECAACCIESQPCDVGLAVKVERERIIKLLEADGLNCDCDWCQINGDVPSQHHERILNLLKRETE